MPANLSPEYKDAEAKYRAAREPEERLQWLREMLRTVPKHKGTDHLQADLKTRIKELNEEIRKARKHGRRGPSVAIRPEGAAQIALIGPPGSGKSTLHARLTGSAAATSEGHHPTQMPLPGMLKHLDIQFQLVDLPPVSAGFMVPWIPNALAHADGALLVVDTADPAVLNDVAAIHERLAEKGFVFTPGPAEGAPDGDPGPKSLPTLLVATKRDLLAGDPREELAAFRELLDVPYQARVVSAKTGNGLEEIGRGLFDLLGVVRIYTKVPGHAADMTRPFTLRRGATVTDVARLVHRGLADELKAVRIWGAGCFAGQHVGHDHTVTDGDVIEIHW